VPKPYPLPGPVARSLEVVGDRWTLLVVRELLLGGRRWAELERALPGIPSNLLAERLRLLEEEGVVGRTGAGRAYRLTAKGRDLNIALSGLRQWGDKYLNEKPPRLLRRKADKKPVIAAFVPKGADVLRFDELELVPGPGLKVG